MSTLKIVVSETEILKFLQENFDANVSTIKFLTGGEMSQAFSFVSEQRSLVIRVNVDDESFEKDKFAYQNFGDSGIPIPKVLLIGSVNDLFYFCVSTEAKGVNLKDARLEKVIASVPHLFEILDRIHQVDIRTQEGYGEWDKDGNASFSSWKDYLLYKQDDVYSNWDELYQKTFLEKYLVEQILKHLEHLISFVPEERFLVHGDFGTDNVMLENGSITGVLDWGESMYGDFLYDVAWLEFWSPQVEYSQRYQEHSQKMKRELLNFDKRLLCYMLHLGLGAIGFFALSEQKESYDWAKKRLISLIQD